ELGGPWRGWAPVDSRLSGRRAMERGRGRQELVRADQIAAVVPADPRRHASGGAAVAELRQPGFLSNADELKAALGAVARAHGFDTIGVVGPDAIPEAKDRFASFLADGAHGDMDWLARDPDRRADPRTFWPQVRSIIMLRLHYGPAEDPLRVLAQPRRRAIS